MYHLFQRIITATEAILKEISLLKDELRQKPPIKEGTIMIQVTDDSAVGLRVQKTDVDGVLLDFYTDATFEVDQPLKAQITPDPTTPGTAYISRLPETDPTEQDITVNVTATYNGGASTLEMQVQFTPGAATGALIETAVVPLASVPTTAAAPAPVAPVAPITTGSVPVIAAPPTAQIPDVPAPVAVTPVAAAPVDPTAANPAVPNTPAIAPDGTVPSAAVPVAPAVAVPPVAS